MYFFEMSFDTELVAEANKEYNIDLKNYEIVERMKRLAKKKAKELFDQGKNFNFEIFKWALDDVLKMKKEYDLSK